MIDTVYTSDPQKGQWGGHPRRNHRELTATIEPYTEESSGGAPGDEQWYRIGLRVRSTDPQHPLGGTVVFHLHPTFPTPKEVEVDEKGEARLELLAWGSFTVGAVADEGATKLELDLAEVATAPERFLLM